MITRHQKTSALLYSRKAAFTTATTTTARDRSSLLFSATAVSVPHRKRPDVGERRFFRDEKEEALYPASPSSRVVLMGSKKRTLMTAAAALACLVPSSYSNTALASGDSVGNFWRSETRNAGNRFFSYHPGRKQQQQQQQQQQQPDTDDSRRSSATRDTPLLLQVLQTLVRRLNEPVPLRASGVGNAPSSSSSSSSAPSRAVEEKKRTAELANELVASYTSLPPLRRFGMSMSSSSSQEDSVSCERGDILEFLAMECCPNGSDVQTAMNDYKRQLQQQQQQQEQQHSSTTSTNTYEKLKKATTPIYERLTEFILQQNAVTGMGFLVSLREDLLTLMRYQSLQQHEASVEAKVLQQRLKDFDSHLKTDVFRRWFVPGLLSHERITYDSTPAKIIEAIATKEAVHPMKSLDDLKERLGSSKRVFALFHPCLPNQPLVFVHVALLPHGLPSSMDEIMASKNNNNDDDQEQRPRVAAFYSISNGVKGLVGVGLGEYLLKESIHALKDELSSLQTFVTLSPIPKFRKWVQVAFLKEEQKHQQHRSKGEHGERLSSLLSISDRKALHRCGLVSSHSPFPWKEFLDRLEETDFSRTLIEQAQTTTDRDIYNFLVNNRQEGSDKDEENEDGAAMLQRTQFFVLRSVLLKLASSYLWLEKHRGKPLDKVCSFHVGNGAELHDLHFGADLSRGGLSNSYGLMANYLYDTDRISRNQANFESSGYVVPVGPGVRKLLEIEEEEEEEEEERYHQQQEQD